MRYAPGLWLFILASIIIAGLWLYSWRFRHEETGQEFLFLMAAAFVWTAGFTLETAVTSLAAKLALVNFEFIGITLLPLGWVFLALSYTGRRIIGWRRVLLVVIPVLTNLVIWTNPLHHWFMGEPWIVYDEAPFPVLNTDYQFWFYYIHAPSSYLYILMALVILVRFLHRVGPIYKPQCALMLLSLLLPTLMDVSYVLGYSPVRHYNYTTAAFSLSGLLLVWSLFRYRFLALAPLARDTVIDNLSDGVIVFDHKDRVAEINATARRSLGLGDEILGQPVGSVANDPLRTIAAIIREGRSETTVEIEGPAGRCFDLRISPVRNSRQVRIGWVAVLHDITERMNLFHQVQTLSNQDSLTGIYNQRCFLEFFERALAQAKRPDGLPLAVVMIDVDYFKQVNDTFGHATGDQALVAITQAIQSGLRKNDVFGRLGGEEFAALLLDVAPDDAETVVERLRAAVETIRVPCARGEIRVTASFGLISTQGLEAEQLEVDNLLHRADQALYQAKRAGRNRVARLTD